MEHKKTIQEEVYSLIGDSLGIPIATITETSKINDLSEDSIKLFELLLAFEKKFQLKTAYEDIARLVTVGDIIAYVERCLGGNPAEHA